MILEFIYWVSIILFTLTSLIIGLTVYYNEKRDPLFYPKRKGNPVVGTIWLVTFACIIAYWVVT